MPPQTPAQRLKTHSVRKHQVKLLILAVVLVSIIVGSTVYLSQPERLNHQYNFILAWGSKGFGPGQFNYPAGVAVDSTRERIRN